MTVVLLAGGAVLLVAGAELLVRGAARLATAAGVSSLVIGLTVVAFGTSAPELAVSLGATWSGEPGIAVGNVVGSNIFNVLFILGLSALFTPLVVKRQLVRLDVPIMVAATVLLLVLARDAFVGRGEGLLLAALLVGYTVFLVRHGREEPRPDDPAPRGSRLLLVSALLSLAGLALLVAGSRFLVQGAVVLAGTLGVSDVVIGLTVIAAGTSLPELATSVLASLRGERDIAVGNVVGSNIFNILGIIGVCGALAPGGMAVAPSIRAFDMPVMLGVALVTLPIFLTRLRVSRAEGLLFVAYYLAYTTFLILRATQHDALAGFGRVMLVVVPATLIAVAVPLVKTFVRRQASAG